MYAPTDKVSTTMPSTMSPNSSDTFTMAFEIPDTVDPQTVHFDGSFAS
jgi:hypothetical protein